MVKEPKAKKLQAIHSKWLKQCQCELRKTATQGVPGCGSAEAQVVFIGEAPGKTEDKEGRPFLGGAGKFLNEMLDSIKLNREDVYITNIVKYRPPNNRDPLPKEVAHCAKWLEEELDIIKPKLVVFLGRHALLHFFPDAKIGEVHGKVLKKETAIGSLFLALYHPAAALYNGKLRRVELQDFKKIAEIVGSTS